MTCFCVFCTFFAALVLHFSCLVYAFFFWVVSSELALMYIISVEFLHGSAWGWEHIQTSFWLGWIASNTTCLSLWSRTQSRSARIVAGLLRKPERVEEWCPFRRLTLGRLDLEGLPAAARLHHKAPEGFNEKLHRVAVSDTSVRWQQTSHTLNQ